MPSSLSCFFILFLVISSQSILAATTPRVYTVSPKNISSDHHHVRNQTYTWHDFEKFQDASKGSHVQGISTLKKYFNRFGYLEEEDMTNSTDFFDSNLETAIKRYQSRLGISVTGELDSATLTELMSPRCGVADDINTQRSQLHATGEKYVYFTGRPRWARTIPMTLTYAFSPQNTITSPRPDDLRHVFQRAFARWASVIPVTFVESDDYGFADIKIGFYYGDHGDGEAFDGVLGVLAHAFSPESGRFHLDAAETWAVDFEAEKSRTAVDLESVATHEIGHLLGLGHTDVREAVMYPSLRPREKKMELKVDDIIGVQALYGSNPDFNLEAYSESDMSSSSGAVDRKVGEGRVLVSWVLVIMTIYVVVLHVPIGQKIF